MEKDFYEILGLTEDEKQLQGEAFEKALKTKYKKLAKKWHPDKFATKSEEERKKAEDTFKGISEAYETLSDADKRKQYDFQSQGFGGFGGDPFEGFGDMFGSMFRRNRPRPMKGGDAYVEINVSLKEAMSGCTKEYEYWRNVPCHHCNGTGSRTGKSTVCPHCNGTGEERVVQSNGYMQTINITTCRHCHGTGKINTDPCPECSGTGMEKEKVTNSMTIPPDTLPDSTIVVRGMGDVINGGEPGNLVIRVVVDDFQGYFTHYYDLVWVQRVPMFDALLGTEFDITLPDGEKRRMRIKELTKDKTEYKIAGKGLFDREYGTRGDVVIRIEYIYPDKLSSKQRELIKKLKEKK